MSSVLLSIKNVCFNFGAVSAADNICLDLNKNEIHALIGPNGAGKTTLINQIYGTIKPSKGKIFLNKKNITNMSIVERVHLGIRRSFQINTLINEFTVIENLIIAYQSINNDAFNFFKQSFTDSNLINLSLKTLSKIKLLEKKDYLVSNLSYGEKRLLEIGLTIIGKPKLIILDEPLAGAGEKESFFLIKLVKELSNTNTILLIEHDMDAVFKLANKISVLVEGKIIASGNKNFISKNKKVREAYLGN